MPSGTWTAKTSMPSPLSGGMASFLLANSKIYVVGGVDTNLSTAIQDCREYATLGDFWTEKRIIPLPARARAVGLALGVDLDTGYVFGGRDNNAKTHYNVCHEYTQSTDTWAAKNNMPINKAGHSGWALDADTGILAAGTKYGSSQVLSPETLKYTKSSDAYVQRADLLSPNRDSCGSFFMGNKGYLCGGSTSVTDIYASSAGDTYDNDEYDDATGVWTSVMDLVVPARSCSGGGALTSSGCGYIMVGSANSRNIQDCDEYNRTANIWASKTDCPYSVRLPSVEVASSSELFLIAGYSRNYVYSFSMPSVPWVANSIPGHEELNVPIDTNIQFDILDNTGVDQNTITVKINGVNVIVNGVFQPNYTGTIAELV
jgi:hypothetical protein